MAGAIAGTLLLAGAAFAALGYATQSGRGTIFGQRLAAALCGALFIAEGTFLRPFTPVWPLELALGLATMFALHRSGLWKTLAASIPLAGILFLAAQLCQSVLR